MKIGRFRSFKGFTLIEVLVTVFVLALGLIGFLQMDIYSSQRARGTFFSSTAGLITTEFSERIYANRQGLLEGYYDEIDQTLWNSTPLNCVENICSPEDIAKYDQWVWLQGIKSQLPWGEDDYEDRAIISGDGPDGKGVGASGELTLTVKWLEVGAPGDDVASFSIEVNVLLPGVRL
jgi:type IV pilus assembly protein PilV